MSFETSQTAKEQQEVSWSDCYDVPGPDLFEKVMRFAGTADKARLLFPHFLRRPVCSANVNRVKMTDRYTGQVRDMIMLGSNSYLGLTNHPKVIEAAVEATKKYGYGAGSVSLYSGTTDLHIELEKRMAAFYQCEDAIIFPTGYAANVSTIAALLHEQDVAVNDLYNHASIFDGCKLSGAKIETYAHARMGHLERVLQENCGDDHGTLVITDGVFSMEGDVARLDEIVRLARTFNARVMLDDAHSLGVIGPTGKGTAEKFGLQGKIDVTVGTLSKCLGGIGGVVAGSAELVDYLRFYARAYFFSGAVPAPVIAGSLAILDIMEEQPEIRENLWQSVRYMIENLSAAGFKLCKTQSAIIPVVIGDETKLKNMLRDLTQAGIFMNYVASPAVARNKCRLRMSMMAGHSRKDLDYVIETMEALGRKYDIL
ncbi:MAG: aminotransferase class I/II-fold pyridoxal phosphate-dependent enzyme [Planctomycetota bacterium]|nr:aminotransferase class I/II-fold pyridoxal phosphate-dependent enzyme [Planctomycetota bacterium]